MTPRGNVLAGLALVVIAAAPGGACAVAPAAQTAGAAATVVSGVDVVAPGRMKSPPSQAAVDAYVGAIGVTSIQGQLATWSRTAVPSGGGGPMAAGGDSLAGQTICPQVIGLPAAYADFIVGRIRTVGLALGAPMSAQTCRPLANNVAIVFPQEAPAFIRKLADDKPEAFGFPSHGALVQDLARPLPPIKAWYGVQTTVTERVASRLSTTHRSIIYQVLIVVDRDRTDALSMGQLADYLAMIALARVEPDKVPPDAPSILNVFTDAAAGRPAPESMTRMDAAYLQALYAIGPRQPGEKQNQQIASRVRARLTGR